ncbi:hypothetical protein VCR31J2_1310117 [Vibrio coralliirubri]|uniref:Uncharacterized protein n=1 Tax=Vibrio coralliirubri TaxID=1516159 RepID=A0AA87BYT6_9VIBR|nr:hypothetical protein VCR31J2_1310117 [Vibrio coralliirubri]
MGRNRRWFGRDRYSAANSFNGCSKQEQQDTRLRLFSLLLS